MYKYKILSCKMYGLKHITLKNSMPILRVAVGGTVAKFPLSSYYIFCRTCVLAVPRTIKVGLTKIGNQAKPQKYSEN